MLRKDFEVLATLAHGAEQQIGIHHLLAGHRVKLSFDEYKHSIHKLISYGFVKRLDEYVPLFCSGTYLQITSDGLAALDLHELDFYKGTTDQYIIRKHIYGTDR